MAGLTAAGLLARAGLEVVALEAQPQIGGYLAGFRRRGFHFDSSIEWLNQCGPGGFVTRLWGSLGGDLPEFPALHRILRYRSDEHDYLLTDEPDRLRDQLMSDFPQDAAGIRAFFADARKVGAWMATMGDRVRAAETMSAFERVTHGLGLSALALPSLKYLCGSIEGNLDRYFSIDGVSRIFSHQEKFMSVIVPVGWAYTSNYQVPPRGGSHGLARWLAERARYWGARIFTGRQVRAVRTDDRKRATGVDLEDGTSIRARAVIAACDTEALFGELLPRTRATEAQWKRLRDAELYHSCFTLYLGLDCDPAEMGFGEEMVSLSRSDVPREAHRSGSPDTSLITIVAPSARDPSLAPSGKGTLMVQVPTYFEHERTWRTGVGLRRGDAYQALKESFADRILERIEQQGAPGLRKHLEVVETATPITYHRYTGNARGSIMGAKPSGRNIRTGVAGYRTPIRGLVVGGHCAEYGGGVPMAVKAAANASLLLLRDLDPRAADDLRALIDDEHKPRRR